MVRTAMSLNGGNCQQDVLSFPDPTSLGPHQGQALRYQLESLPLTAMVSCNVEQACMSVLYHPMATRPLFEHCLLEQVLQHCCGSD